MGQAVRSMFVPSKHTGSNSHPVRIGFKALARSGPDDCCTPACFRTGSVWPKPDQAIQVGSGSVLHSMLQAFFGKTQTNRMPEVGSGIYDYGCTLAVMAITGHNQNASGSDQACLLGKYCHIKKIRNVFGMHCFNHKPPLRKECVRGVYKMSDNADTMSQWLGGQDFFPSTEKVFFCSFLSVNLFLKSTDENCAWTPVSCIHAASLA